MHAANASVASVKNVWMCLSVNIRGVGRLGVHAATLSAPSSSLSSLIYDERLFFPSLWSHPSYGVLGFAFSSLRSRSSRKAFLDIASTAGQDGVCAEFTAPLRRLWLGKSGARTP